MGGVVRAMDAAMKSLNLEKVPTYLIISTYLSYNIPNILGFLTFKIESYPV